MDGCGKNGWSQVRLTINLHGAAEGVTISRRRLVVPTRILPERCSTSPPPGLKTTTAGISQRLDLGTAKSRAEDGNMDPALMANLTLGPPPLGVKSNFENPETLSFEGHASMITCIVVGAIVIALRMYVKAFITKLYGWDDVWCVLAWFTILMHNVVSMMIMGVGPGRMLGAHQWDVKLVYVQKATLQRVLAAVCLYAASALFVKLSLFCLYLRLFQVKEKTRILIYGGMVACFIIYTASVIANCIWFVPLPGRPQTITEWFTQAGRAGKNPYKLSISQGVFGTISDIYLLAIPVQSVLALRMPLARRIGVSLIFGTGLIATACSVGSLVFRIRGLNSTDQMWDTIKVYIFSSAEVTAGIVCASTPICAAFFRGDRGAFFKSFSQRYFSRLRPTRKSYMTGSGGSGPVADRTIGSEKRRRAKGDMDTESVDSLFHTQVVSEWDRPQKPVELQTVVVK